MDVDIANNSKFYNGDEGSTINNIYNHGYLSSLESIFFTICLVVENCNIEAYIICKNSLPTGVNMYKLQFYDKKIAITVCTWIIDLEVFV